ncbi:MAG: hypothetical protein ACE5KT_04725 [Methanosarcinales archaeon]
MEYEFYEEFEDLEAFEEEDLDLDIDLEENIIGVCNYCEEDVDEIDEKICSNCGAVYHVWCVSSECSRCGSLFEDIEIEAED